MYVGSFLKTTKLFSKLVVLFYISVNGIREFQLLYILAGIFAF